MSRLTASLLVCSLFVAIGSLTFTHCSVSGGSVTKYDLCTTLTYSWCNRAGDLACEDKAKCKSDNQSDCSQLFDGTCKATQSMVDQVHHDIDNIIKPKDSCDSLNSVISYLEGTIGDIKSSPCDGH